MIRQPSARKQGHPAGLENPGDFSVRQGLAQAIHRRHGVQYVAHRTETNDENPGQGLADLTLAEYELLKFQASLVLLVAQVECAGQRANCDIAHHTKAGG